MGGAERTGFGPFADIWWPRSFRAAELMPAGRKQVDMALLHINGKLPVNLDGIRMKKNVMSGRNLTNFPDRLDRSDLIVSIHDRNQNRVRPYGPFQLFYTYQAVRIHIQISDFRPLSFQILATVQNRMMLDAGSNDVLPLDRKSVV